MRVFLGLAADHLAGVVAERLPELAPPEGGRLVPPEMWHLTLAFFGEMPEVAVKAIEDRTEEYALGQPPMGISFERVCAIGRRPPIRVWALASESNPGKAAIHRAKQLFRPWLSERELLRPPLVHLTLARGQWATQPKGHRLEPPLSFRAAAVVLYQSHLQPSGVHYERLATFHLAE